MHVNILPLLIIISEWNKNSIQDSTEANTDISFSKNFKFSINTTRHSRCRSTFFYYNQFFKFKCYGEYDPINQIKNIYWSMFTSVKKWLNVLSLSISSLFSNSIFIPMISFLMTNDPLALWWCDDLTVCWIDLHSLMALWLTRSNDFFLKITQLRHSLSTLDDFVNTIFQCALYINMKSPRDDRLRQDLFFFKPSKFFLESISLNSILQYISFICFSNNTHFYVYLLC